MTERLIDQLTELCFNRVQQLTANFHAVKDDVEESLGEPLRSEMVACYQGMLAENSFLLALLTDMNPLRLGIPERVAVLKIIARGIGLEGYLKSRIVDLRDSSEDVPGRLSSIALLETMIRAVE